MLLLLQTHPMPNIPNKAILYHNESPATAFLAQDQGLWHISSFTAQNLSPYPYLAINRFRNWQCHLQLIHKHSQNKSARSRCLLEVAIPFSVWTVFSKQWEANASNFSNAMAVISDWTSLSDTSRYCSFLYWSQSSTVVLSHVTTPNIWIHKRDGLSSGGYLHYKAKPSIRLRSLRKRR